MSRADRLQAPTVLSREELAWASGFFDGEGYVGINRGSRSRPAPSIRVTITQQDRRVLDRFQSVVGMGRIYLRKATATKRAVHQYDIAHYPAAQAICAMLWTWLSPVKREQFRTALERARAFSKTQACAHGFWPVSRCLTCVRAQSQRRMRAHRLRQSAQRLPTDAYATVMESR